MANSLATNASESGPQLSVGDFCLANGEIGQVSEVAESSTLIRFFDGPHLDGTRVATFLIADVETIVLPQQTRVWVPRGSAWQVGRIVAHPDHNAPFYVVALPDREGAQLEPGDFHVMSSGRPADPLLILEAKVAESAFFFERRTNFVREMFRQASAAEGLTGIISSSARLHRHQVCAARRVLSDPTRRYLLADEVGLGKTIEAGMIIRQSMLDAHGSVVRIFVPGPLVEQWEAELKSKFRVANLNGGTVLLGSHEVLSDRTNDGCTTDLLVVDEAHQVTQQTGDSPAFDRLAGLARDAGAVLLLSATPVRSNEEAFLRLLHLLDPDSYSLDDLDGFRARVAQRDIVSNAVGLLDEVDHGFLLDEAADMLHGAFPEDGHLAQKLDGLRRAVKVDDHEKIEELAKQTKAYVSETYRLHRRMIRTRRNERIQREFPVRQRIRHGDWLTPAPHPGRSAVVQVLDDLRLEIAAHEELHKEELFAVLGARLTSSIEALPPIASFLLGGTSDDLSKRENDALENLQDHPIGSLLVSEIQQLSEQFPDGDGRMEVVSDWAQIRVGHKKMAICTSYSSVAVALADHLEVRFGEHRVARMVRGMDSRVIDAEVGRARTDDQCSILVCDAVAEEGWNLQFVDDVLHLDLPWSANRVEQRIGRFDRYRSDISTGGPITSSVVTDGEEFDHITGVWRQFFDQCVHLFEQSAASLQYVLPEVEASLLASVLDEGFEGMTRLFSELEERMMADRKSIEGQDLLDSIDDTAEEYEFFDQLIDADERTDAIGLAVRQWVGESLGFTVRTEGPTWKFGVSTHKPPLLPEQIVHRLGMLNFGRAYAVDRWSAEGHPMARPGDPFIDAFLALCLEDDRGLTFARAVFTESLPPGSEPIPAFAFNFICEPDRTPLETLPPLEASAMWRQSVRLLPPSMEEVWLSPGRPELHGKTLDGIRGPKGANLGKDQELWSHLVSTYNWPEACRSAGKDAMAIAYSRPSVSDRSADALKRLKAEALASEIQALARSHVLGETFDRPSADRRQLLVESCISSPKMRLDACGVVLLAPLEPQ